MARRALEFRYVVHLKAFQVDFRRGRNQPRRPALAKIRAGSPASTMGPGTAKNARISPVGKTVVWMFRYVSPARSAAVNTASAVAAVPPSSNWNVRQ
jgi:hypothetical protein